MSKFAVYFFALSSSFLFASFSQGQTPNADISVGYSMSNMALPTNIEDAWIEQAEPIAAGLNIFTYDVHAVISVWKCPAESYRVAIDDKFDIHQTPSETHFGVFITSSQFQKCLGSEKARLDIVVDKLNGDASSSKYFVNGKEANLRPKQN